MLRYYAQFFISIGMPREEYWHGNVYAVEEYLGAYKLRLNEANTLAWRQGMYTFDAVSAVISNIHFDKGSHKFVTPMDKPMELFPPTPEELETERRKKIDRFVAGLNAFHAKMEAKKNA